MELAVDFIAQKKAKQAKINQAAKELAEKFKKILDSQPVVVDIPKKAKGLCKKATQSKAKTAETPIMQEVLELTIIEEISSDSISETVNHFVTNPIEEIASENINEAIDLSVAKQEDETESALSTVQNLPTKFIWWINRDQYKVVVTMPMDKRLKEKVQKLKKVSDGGWLIDEDSCIQHDESPSLSGIVINLKQRDFLQEKNFPGVVAQA